ncbi:molybdopterin-guanine dinucleotide biosynthesis protein B [Natranaerobius trueperi]|uniref:Molybdopterin-guanine dinucleotide biosynthesis protein B n=1 Tax=Natranaerobius trueperi TaxID=759412 RepID=A0A226BYF7_9FIRM|nr:molybdopterin-guanine dinucleotide biosynthesis protein B [Natranaerobius trueperi]OWZ83961.1 molybdopterin-guanine dinucleotide biosynthesis protein B [Natranaerobius trueperi]
MRPVISVVGKSKSGKTTLVCKLIRELKSRGYKVSTVKHDVHGFDIDKPGKDTWKHGEAGASTVVISSPTKMAMIQQLEQEKTLDEILEKIEDADIILTEGYKREDKPKIEVVKTDRSTKPVCNPSELVAIASNDKNFEFEKTPVYHWDDARGLAKLIEKEFLSNT